MPVTVPPIQQFDLGSTLSNVETIKGQRLRNRLASAQIASAERTAETRQRRLEMEKLYDQLPDRIAAFRQAGMHEEAAQAFDTYVQMNQTQADALKLLTPFNYKKIRSDLIKSGVVDGEEIPVNYDRKFISTLR